MGQSVVLLNTLGVVLSPLLYDRQMCWAWNIVVFMCFGIVTLVFKHYEVCCYVSFLFEPCQI